MLLSFDPIEGNVLPASIIVENEISIQKVIFQLYLTEGSKTNKI